MKKILVTVKHIIEVPNSIKIKKVSEHGITSNYIKIGKKLASPDLTWFSYNKKFGEGEQDSELVMRLIPSIMDFSMQEFSYESEPDVSC